MKHTQNYTMQKKIEIPSVQNNIQQSKMEESHK